MQSFKIGILGDVNTGKSMLKSKYLEKGFGFLSEMNGMGPYIKQISLDNINYRLSIWDMPGYERYHSLTIGWLNKFNGLILMYSIIESQSFENIKRLWITYINQNIKDINGTLKIPIVLVGNKKDKEDERFISEEEGRKIAEDNGFEFFEISILTGENVNEAFQKLLEMMIKENKNHNINNKNILLKINNNNNKKIDKEGRCLII